MSGLRVGIEERMDGDEIRAETGDEFAVGDRLMVMSLGCGGCKGDGDVSGS